MRDFVFENSTKVFFGRGCVERYLGALLKEYGETVLLVYGGGSIKGNGVYDQVMSILASAGKRVVEFHGVMPNPTYTKVLEGVDLARRERVSLVLAVGGGSVMDCGKAIALAVPYDGDVWEGFWAKKGAPASSPGGHCDYVRHRKRVQRRRGGHQRGGEDQDRPGLPPVQPPVCPDGPHLYPQRPQKPDALRRLRRSVPHYGDLFQRSR